MKRRITSILIVMLALFAPQYVMASGFMASHSVKTTSDYQELFKATFDNDLCGFTEEGDIDPIWVHDADGTALADGLGKTNSICSQWFISPAIKLADSDNILSFDHLIKNMGKPSNQNQVAIREVNGSWTLLTVTYPTEEGKMVSSGEIALPEKFNGKEVQVAFKYKTNGYSEMSSYWKIDNIIVKAKVWNGPKVEPEISFSADKADAYMGMAFVAPMFNNPNNVEVAFTSSNPEVAAVDATTGAVTLTSEGTTTITATSVESNKFNSATVSYELKVNAAIELVTVFEQDFTKGMGDFFVEGFNGDNNNMWKFNGSVVQIDGYGKVKEPMTNYLVSPEIALGTGVNTVAFKFYFTNYDLDNAVENQIGFSIRKVGGEWENLPLSDYTNKKDIDCNIILPAAYAGEKVQIAFRYTSRSSNLSSIWNLYNVAVKKEKVPGFVDVELFKATFDNDLCGFTEEGDTEALWAHDADGTIYADGLGKTNSICSQWLISPEIQLASDKNTLTFDHMINNMGKVDNQNQVAIREVNGSWALLSVTYPEEEGTMVSSGEIAIPERFNGKKIQIAFKYKTNGTEEMSSYWKIDNFIIKTVEWDGPQQTPELSFVSEKENAYLETSFILPALNNPNKLVLTYSSSNPEVATIDETTGAVTLLKEGTTTITATSVETKQFSSVAVSFELTVNAALKLVTVFEQDFTKGMGDFFVEGFNGDNNNMWKYNGNVVQIDGYGKVKEPMTNYLVSPEIALGAGINTVAFKFYFTNYDVDNTVENQIGFSIRKVGGEWENLTLSDYTNKKEIICNLMIPASYAGEKVQIAFRYTSRSSNLSSIWNLYNVAVKKQIVKKDPQISFEKESYDYYFFGGEAFLSPVLNNPNNVEVTYSLDNSKVASVDTFGNVIVWGLGTTVITATSVETDEFKSATASYTLNVIDVPTGIDTIEGVSIKDAVIYDLQGNRVTNPTKGVYVVNGKKVIIK